ncbi:MAG: acryloyl-CoA reductase [Oligoflexales bacterium]
MNSRHPERSDGSLTFNCIRVEKSGSKIAGKLAQMRLSDLDQGEVVLKVAYSSVNYKDALGVTGTGDIYKKLPIVAGIDVSGTVLESQDPRYKTGDKVLVTGCGLGEKHDGGYSELLRVPADWVVKLPVQLTELEAMIYGTAGFTTALAIHQMERMGQTPKLGKMVVTGASGGVGSFAVSMMSRLGYEVVAVTGKPDRKAELVELGAAEVIGTEALGIGDKPMERIEWGGAIDNVGGKLLAGLVKKTNLWGSVASIGLAGGANFEASVFPHILRGVNILGISSTNCPMDLRAKLWTRLATELKPKNLAGFVTETLNLRDVPSFCEKMIARKTSGRAVVKL